MVLYMTGILGFALAIFSIYAGYNEYTYWYFIIPAALGGAILYFLASPTKNLLVFAQGGVGKLATWIIWVYFAQIITWSILYGIGYLFS